EERRDQAESCEKQRGKRQEAFTILRRVGIERRRFTASTQPANGTDRVGADHSGRNERVHRDRHPNDGEAAVGAGEFRAVDRCRDVTQQEVKRPDRRRKRESPEARRTWTGFRGCHCTRGNPPTTNAVTKTVSAVKCQ